MENGITRVHISEEITSVTLFNVPYEVENISSVFSLLSEALVNIDIISQSPPIGRYVDLSFTAKDEELSKIMGVLPRIKERLSDITSAISSGNAKIVFIGEDINEIPGVASKVFDLFCEAETDIHLITTSENDISVLVPGHAVEKIKTAIQEILGVTPAAY
jgi:aspartate kinase